MKFIAEPWNKDHIHVQREDIRDEGIWYFIEALTDRGRAVLEEFHEETHFCGKGAKQKADRVCRILREQLLQEL